MPGSQGPKQSGSVMVPTLVPTHTSETSLSSVLSFLAGGGDKLRSSKELVADCKLEELLLLLPPPLPPPFTGCSCLTVEVEPTVVEAGLGGGPDDDPLFPPAPAVAAL